MNELFPAKLPTSVFTNDMRNICLETKTPRINPSVFDSRKINRFQLNGARWVTMGTSQRTKEIRRWSMCIR